MSRAELAARQAALVGALVAGAPLPPGFDEDRVRAAAKALLRKRSGEVGAAWPALRAWYGPTWTSAFADWAAGRPTQGSLRDGWDLARLTVGLTGDALVELARREVLWRYDGAGPPRPRRRPTLRRAAGSAVVQLGGRVWTWRRPPR